MWSFFFRLAEGMILGRLSMNGWADSWQDYRPSPLQVYHAQGTAGIYSISQEDGGPAFTSSFSWCIPACRRCRSACVSISSSMGSSVQGRPAL